MRTFHRVVIGATFDHIHKGHEALLIKAFEAGEHVLIGLTTNVYLREFKPGIAVKPFEERKKNLEEWLDRYGYRDRFSIVPIDDPWGPLVTGEPTMEAIVVSRETRMRADALNTMRDANGLSQLSIIEIPVILSKKAEVHVSSTNIRSGFMTEKGDLVLPQKFRAEMKKPLGTVLDDTDADEIIRGDRGKLIITVGDKTTERILTLGGEPNASAIDLQVERKKVTWEKTLYDRLIRNSAVHELVSGPGYVSHEATCVIKQWANDGYPKTVLVVDGEEDLLVLPLLISAPHDSVLYYGQPRKGLVRVVVDDQLRKKATDFLNHFER